MENLILSELPFTPTSDQAMLIRNLSDFIHETSSRKLFLLKGYAGTGKTTVISALVNALRKTRIKTVLLAPTGRAAKVLSEYSHQQAFTIHKKIYFPGLTPEGYIVLQIKDNLHKNTIFIVDESSMIPDSDKGNRFGNYSGRSLLDDLMDFVYNDQNCSMILIGDTAQLPPIGLAVSPALDVENLRSRFNIQLFSYELTQVVRQAQNSEILQNATALRLKISDKDVRLPFFVDRKKADFKRVLGYDLEDELNNAYGRYGSDEVVVICRSNKQANLFNRQIRSRVWGRNEELAAGDQLMIVKNNYFWLPEESSAGFIANGEMAQLLKIKKIEERYGFHFAHAIIHLIDYPQENDLEVLLLMDTLDMESPALTWEKYQQLYQEIMQDYMHIPSKRQRMELIRSNEYFNALQIKFAYALTCHKTQGGQWKCVFVDQGWITEEMIEQDYLRWLYTALTRASEKVFLLNFADRFFEETT
ncbi:MAG: AAA family ATPase [Bacteroidales bacterium]|nr:AAA family ATPase [Bacteroidales bacterium]